MFRIFIRFQFTCFKVLRIKLLTCLVIQAQVLIAFKQFNIWCCFSQSMDVLGLGNIITLSRMNLFLKIGLFLTFPFVAWVNFLVKIFNLCDDLVLLSAFLLGLFRFLVGFSGGCDMGWICRIDYKLHGNFTTIPLATHIEAWTGIRTTDLQRTKLTATNWAV